MRVALRLQPFALALMAFAWLPPCPSAAAAQEELPTECDRLAAHPSDPDRITDGVPSGAVRGWNQAAIDACRAAVKVDPANARLRYQLGRALFYSGQQSEAVGHLQLAAERRHRQAQFVLGLLYTDGVPDALEQDVCRALALWQDAAGRDHFAARVALGRDFARGIYGPCPNRPDVAQVDAWLASARSESRDYYQQLLIDWSRETIAARP